ncbi:hypothetical protein NKI82_33215 [Mesorhizobium sp. M0482]|uniref:hypothetical protein n=1 Tax=Mesorhizobium sp. M0482 TaxID=2956948 RepID=UPI003336B415
MAPFLEQSGAGGRRDTYGFALSAQPGRSQGRPATNASSQLIEFNLSKIVADAGYRGHNAPKDKMFKVHVAGYRCGLTKTIKRATATPGRRRTGHGHLKQDHRMGRNFLAFPKVTPTTLCSPPSATNSASC